MTDEELQAIHEHIKTPVVMSQESLDSDAWPVIHQAWRDRAALLAEVEQLREIVQQVASLWVHYDPDDNVSLYSHGYEIDVAALVDKARDALKK